MCIGWCTNQVTLRSARYNGKDEVFSLHLSCFQNLKTTVLKLLEKKLGPKFTTEDEAAWNKTIDVAYSVIFKGLDKSQESGS